jgi:chromosome segregation ATPase
MAQLSLKANAQSGAVTPAPSMDQKKLQVQTLQVIIKLTQSQIAEVQKEIIQLTDEEKKLQQKITEVKQRGNTPAASSTGIPDDADTQQQVQGNGGQGDQQAKLQQLQKQLKKKQNQIEQLQIELQQLKLKLPQLQQQLQQIQG